MKDWYRWEEIPKVLLERPPGLVFLLGAADTGKTTLLKQIAASYLDAGFKVGLIDSDLGQSTIGPPTTIGMLTARGDLPDLFWSQALYFVGNNNPVGRLMEVVVGSRRMVDKAIADDAEAIIFDSSGLVGPPYGTALKYHKIDLLRPGFIVAIERTDELEPIVYRLSGCSDTKVLRTRPSAEARPVSTAERTRYRQMQYRRYFESATLRIFDLSELKLYPPGFLYGKVDPIGLLVGLQADDWNTVAVGIIKSLDEGTVSIYAPYPPDVDICGLIAGYIKLSEDGVELGWIRPRQLF